MQPSSVLLVTNVNMASNPRCHKELMALTEAGYRVGVLKFNIQNWSSSFEDEIEKTYPNVTWINIENKSQNLLLWLYATIAHLLGNYALKLSIVSARLISYSIDKRSYILHKKLKRIIKDYDVVIAHNPGTFWAVSNNAIAAGKKFAIDVEDYHPGEYKQKTAEDKMRKLMQATLKNASYVSCASPLIAAHTLQDLPGIEGKLSVVNNVFPLHLQPVFSPRSEVHTSALTLVWFSQYIGLDRGLDDVIEAMNLIHDFEVQLTLIGYADTTIAEALQHKLHNKRHKILIRLPLPEKELMHEVAKHDIGLALEKSPNLNRRLCLTNKLFTYLLCGNAMIASDTEAQVQFMSAYKGIGDVYTSGDVAGLADMLKSYYSNKSTLNEKRLASYALASDELNWDREKKKWLALVNRTLFEKDTHHITTFSAV